MEPLLFSGQKKIKKTTKQKRVFVEISCSAAKSRVLGCSVCLAQSVMKEQMCVLIQLCQCVTDSRAQSAHKETGGGHDQRREWNKEEEEEEFGAQKLKAARRVSRKQKAKQGPRMTMGPVTPVKLRGGEDEG